VPRAVITLPPKARRGEIIEIRTLVGHPMETGYRHDQMGRPIPRDIITRFACTYNGVEICRADFFPAISANPLFTFTTVATESGTLEFTWTGDNGFAFTTSAKITVE
jgi:sulfur-oxidizing protein SoxZ